MRRVQTQNVAVGRRMVRPPGVGQLGGSAGFAPEQFAGQTQSEGAINGPSGYVAPGMPGWTPGQSLLRPGCRYNEKLASVSSGPILTTATSAIIPLRTPGLFCPVEINLFATVDLNDVFLTMLRVGTENMIISGEINGAIFSLDNCCALACIQCLCNPSVPLEFQFRNADAMTQTVTAVVKGTYVNACEPLTLADMLPDACGPKEKMLGFDVVIPASGTIDVPISTSGRFCPRLMFITGADVATVTVAQIKNGTETELLGPIPAAYWALQEGCCRSICFKCLCAPGVQEVFTFTGTAADVIHVDLIGPYSNVC